MMLLRQISKFVNLLWLVFGFILAIIIRIISFVYHIELFGIQASRVGHLAIDPEVARLQFNEIHKTRSQIIFYFEDNHLGMISNRYLHKKWIEALHFGPTRLLSAIKRVQVKFPVLDTSCVSVQQVQVDYRVLDNSIPLINISSFEKDDGLALLRALGLAPQEKFICLAVRDSNYLEKFFPKKDFSYHNYRDSNIYDYEMMCNYFTSRGYYVIRMGKYNSPLFRSNNLKIIDYANSPFRSDFGDVYLFSQCSFVISSSTGMDRLGVLFRKPIGLVNLPLPQEGEFLGKLLKLVMYKNLVNIQNNKIFNFKEILIENNTECYKNLKIMSPNIKYLDNSPEELKLFGIEFLQIIDGYFSGADEYKGLADKFLNTTRNRFDPNLRSFWISPSWLSERI